MASVASEYFKIYSEYFEKYGEKTEDVHWHPTYSEYGSTKSGTVYNRRGYKMGIHKKQNSVQVRYLGYSKMVLHRRFVWECFNGILPLDCDVIVDHSVSDEICKKLTLVTHEEKTAFECRQRDTLRTQLTLNGHYKQHPQCPNYVANHFGVVFSLYTCKQLVTAPNGDGYIQLTMFRECGSKIVKCKHVIIWEAFAGKVVPAGYQIDHIDQDKTNNCPKNLMCLTRKEHMAKTHKENPHILKTIAQCFSKRVVKVSISDGYSVEFESIREAADSLQAGCRHAVGNAVKTGQQYQGYIWKGAEDYDLPGEHWICMGTDDVVEYKVSNLGRVWGPRGYKTFGSKRPGRYLFPYKRRNYGVHELVCMAFHGAKPTVLHTVDHIDGNPHNNKCENLRWATKQEQATNRRSVRPVEGYSIRTGLSIGVWPTIAAAAAATGATSSHITCVIKGRRNSCGKTAEGEKIGWKLACDK